MLSIWTSQKICRLEQSYTIFFESLLPISVLLWPDSFIGSKQELRTRWLVGPHLGQFLWRVDVSHCYMIHSSLSTYLCLNDSYVRKNVVCNTGEKKVKEGSDTCTGRNNQSNVENCIKYCTVNVINQVEQEIAG